jgi:hypothetical protein
MGAYIQAGRSDEAKGILEESLSNSHLVSFKLAEYLKLIE